MTIRINQIAVDFTLEKEHTFADLTTALRAWAHGQDLAILGLLADGRALGPDDKTPLDAIHEVDVEAVPAGERDLARTAVVARFFSLLAQGWEKGDHSLVAELQSEFDSVRSALFPLLGAVAARLEAPLAVLDGPWAEPEALKRSAQRIALEAEGIRRELQNPVAALSETLDTLEFSLVSLETLSSLFQKGLDRDGFDLILHLFTVFEDLVRRSELARRSTGLQAVGWERFNGELQPLLKEAGDALAAADYVLLTDLLEYEVTPRLKTVRSLFPDLVNLDRVTDVL
jgi:hypothetical protein